MYGAFVAGWGVPAVGLAIALIFSGVSFRFGDTCHINHKNSLAGFWIPLLVFAGLTVIIQFTTFGYCIKVYLASLADDSNTTNSSGLPSYAGTLRTVSPRQAYRRVRRVIELQWRGIAIVLLIIADVVFFAVVFVFMDNSETAVQNNPAIASSWISCLALAGGDKNKCLDLAEKLVVNEATIMSVLLLLSVSPCRPAFNWATYADQVQLNGCWLLLLMGRFSMFTGWYDLMRGSIKTEKEFVSVDARAFNKDGRSYEMLASGGKDANPRSPGVMLTPLSPAARSGRGTPDYFGSEAKYQNPVSSFSSPKPPQGRQFGGLSEGQPRNYPDPLSMNRI
jgi:hypothetical protein